MNYLTKIARIQNEYKCGLHPHIANWMYRELASVCTGRRRTMHLLCAELSRKRPLRPYKEVVEI